MTFSDCLSHLNGTVLLAYSYVLMTRTHLWGPCGHVTSVTRRCFGILSGLSHLRGRLPSSIISVLVNALVISQVRYCVSIYGNGSKANLSRLQKIINYGAKIVFGCKKYDHLSVLLDKLGWLSAENLSTYHNLCMVHKVLRLGEPEELAAGFSTVAEVREAREVSARTTRQDRDLHVPRSRTEMEKRRFICRGPIVYNSLPSDLTELSVPSFSRRLRRHLSTQPAAPDWRPLIDIACRYNWEVTSLNWPRHHYQNLGYTSYRNFGG